MVSLVCSGTAARRRRLRRARVALPRKTAELSRRLLLGDTCPQLMPRRWVARAGPLWAWLGWQDWGLGCGRVSCAVACCANTGGSLNLTRIQAWCRLAGLATSRCIAASTWPSPFTPGCMVPVALCLVSSSRRSGHGLRLEKASGAESRLGSRARVTTAVALNEFCEGAWEGGAPAPAAGCWRRE